MFTNDEKIYGAGVSTRRLRKRSRALQSDQYSGRVAALIIICFLSIQLIQAQETTCTLGGQIFQAGQALGDQFTTRCGPAAEFPCFCNPGATPPIDCPYCGIATQENEEGIICAVVDGPTVSVVTLAGDQEECSCRRDLDGNPQSVCFPSDENNPPASAPPPSSPTENVCVLEWADGTTDVFQDGESYGELYNTQCGPPTEYPCFCNVSIPGKLYCPYCSVMTNTGDLACGRIGETFVLVDGTNEQVSCNCRDDLEADCTPTLGIAPSPPSNSTSLRPTMQPSPGEQTGTPTPHVGFVPFPTQSPIPTPTMEPSTPMPSASLPTFDKPSILMPSRNPPVLVSVPGCDYIDTTTGEDAFVATGEALGGDVLQGPCAPSGSFPVLCNPSLPGGVEYPYCVFTATGQLDGSSQFRAENSDQLVVCAKDGDQVTVPTSQGTIESCTCLYLNPFIGAVSSCPDLLVTVPLALTSSPTSAPSPSPTLPGPTAEPTRSTTPEKDDSGDATSSSNRIRGSSGLLLLLPVLIGASILATTP